MDAHNKNQSEKAKAKNPVQAPIAHLITINMHSVIVVAAILLCLSLGGEAFRSSMPLRGVQLLQKSCSEATKLNTKISERFMTTDSGKSI